MFALDAKTAKIGWEFFLVPRAEGDAIRGPLGATPPDMGSLKNKSGIPVSGGGPWASYSLGPKTGAALCPRWESRSRLRNRRARGRQSLQRLGRRARRQGRRLQI